MEDNTLENTYESKNLITKTYFRKKVNAAIKLAKLKKSDVVLDFGCGGGWLEKRLKNYKIYGYDVNPKKTFIKDYRKIKPTKIFVLDVFEHVSINEIKRIITNFKLNRRFDLIVSLPTENLISRKIRRLVGKSEVPSEHITNYKTIVRLLKQNFKLKRHINFFSVSKIYLFEWNS